MRAWKPLFLNTRGHIGEEQWEGLKYWIFSKETKSLMASVQVVETD
jgi:hypothetical protein